MRICGYHLGPLIGNWISISMLLPSLQDIYEASRCQVLFWINFF
jgi:hypothetical protein